MINTKKYYLIILISLAMSNCVEPFEIETETFESAIVIEATITNELKYQEITLSRTFKFEEDGPSIESNAEVKIIDDTQTVYNFIEVEPGRYRSAIKFNALPARTYELSITTDDGRSYASNSTTLTNEISIEDVTTLTGVDESGNDNVSIIVDSFDPSGNSKFYRYEFEETYKIVSRWPSDFEAIIVSDRPPFQVSTVEKTIQDKICFNTINSNSIIQTETTGFGEDRVTEFPVRTIKSNDFILRSRYSILVKQFVQSLEAYTYYKVLNELTSSESLFSQTQPGFFNGNIFSLTNSDEKVLGFFEVASVSSKRIFFNYKDIFPDNDLPPYITDCTPEAPDLTSQDGLSSPLIGALRSSNKYIQDNTDPPFSEEETGPYIIAKSPCIDCTLLGTNVKPDFWID